MLTGIAWDHRRCWGPLEASIDLYAAATGVGVRWDRRSLYSFGEGDLSGYTDAYDLVIFDHPFVGEGMSRGLLLDLQQFLTDEDRHNFDRDAVGASWRSYAYGGGIWALPIDAAAQTAAWRADLLARHDLAVPQTLEAVLALASKLQAHGMSVAWPSVPTDLMCTLVSVAASMGLRPGHEGDDFLALADAEIIVAQLKALAAIAHPQSQRWNPILCLNAMAQGDEIAYAPYLFNYVNYATNEMGKPITFGPSPRIAADLPAHTILGGAGIGISAKSANPQAAFAYAKYLCSPQFQSGTYVIAGGQPGSRTAWQSAESDRHTAGFFSSTLPALDSAFLRPTHPGFVGFFHDATLRLAEVVHAEAPLRPFTDWLNASYARIRAGAVPAIAGAAQ
ncbi:MAG TPA: extracellular solute-binding protein [Devosia sp.]|nr:extracellular solute-binding protein [Devosia sp.]